MSKETERKFLVKKDFKPFSHKVSYIVQGYLCSSPERTVRIRMCDKKGFLTIKGIGNESGLSRYEWEEEIPEQDAAAMLDMCEPGKIEKNRYLIQSGTHVFEVDEFLGLNQGLVIAEIELSSEDENFEKPEWLGDEVSNQVQYFNSSLSKKPYSTW